MAQSYDKIAGKCFPVGKRISGPVDLRIGSVEAQFENRFVSLREVVYATSEGKFFQARSVIVMPDCMLVVPRTAENDFVMVQVFRPGIGEWSWEFPQERMDSGDLTAEAVRCVREEAGLVGDPVEVRVLGKISTMPDRTTEQVHMVSVTGIFDFDSRTDKAEIVEGTVRICTPREVSEMIHDGQIQCPCTIAAYYRSL